MPGRGDEALLRARKVVITGLVPVIHVLTCHRKKDVDARHKATAVRFNFCGQGA